MMGQMGEVYYKWPLFRLFYLIPREMRGVCEGKSIELKCQGSTSSVTQVYLTLIVCRAVSESLRRSLG